MYIQVSLWSERWSAAYIINGIRVLDISSLQCPVTDLAGVPRVLLSPSFEGLSLCCFLLACNIFHLVLHVDDYMQLLCSLWGVKQSHTFKSVTTEKLQTQRPGLILVVQLLLLHPKIAPGVISGEKHGLSVYVSISWWDVDTHSSGLCVFLP